MDHKQGVANVLAIIERANADEWEDGLTWYARAHSEARRISEWSGISHEAACGIIAALSPRVEWSLNLRMAWTLVHKGTVRGLGGNVRKAERILAGEAPLDVLGGPKVRAFYACILDVATCDEVVIDRHAFDVCAGIVGDDESRRKELERKGGYERTAAVYLDAARSLGLRPHEVQAITWETWRRLKNENGGRKAEVGAAL